MNRMRNNRGITLLELIIAIGLVAVVTLAIYTVLQTGVKTFNVNLTSSKDQGNLRSGMMRITKLEHKASSSTCPTANTVKLVISGTSHVIQVVNGSLVDVISSPASTTTLAVGVSTLSASISGTTLTITLTGANGATLTTQFYTN